MNAVIEIPDELYQKMTVRVASLGRGVPEVTVELYERWLDEVNRETKPVPEKSTRAEWLEEWFRTADKAISQAPAGPSAREILMLDRNRLEEA